MAQHDMNIANQGFPAFRADLNNALGALVSNNSGATAPATTFAHQYWVDTSANPSVLKIRNADNDAFITIGTINQTNDTFTLTSLVAATGGSINNTTVGATTPAAGSFTTLNTSGQVVFNDAGANVDFRVEGDTDANLLFVDASADAVGIGTSSPDGLLALPAANSNTPRLRFQHPATDADASIDTFQDGGGTYLSIGTNAFQASNGALTKFDAAKAAAMTYYDTSGLIISYTATSAGSLTERMRITSAGNVDIANGNLVIGTAGKGIDFSADGQAAGMTSELLDDYEEGTWTPLMSADGGGSDNWTSSTATGTYTKTGRQVFIEVDYTYTAVQSSAGYAFMTGLPFAPSARLGFFSVNINNSGGSDTSSYSAVVATTPQVQFVKNQDRSGAGFMTKGAFPAATRTITFQATYTV